MVLLFCLNFPEKLDNYEEEFEEEILSNKEGSKESNQEKDRRKNDRDNPNQQTFQDRESKPSDTQLQFNVQEKEEVNDDYTDAGFLNQQQQSQQIYPMQAEGIYNLEGGSNQYFQREENRPKTHHTHQRPHFDDVNQPPVPVQDNLINADNSPFSSSNQYKSNQTRFQSNNGRPPTHGLPVNTNQNFQNTNFEDFKVMGFNPMGNSSQINKGQSNTGFRKSSQQPQRGPNSYDKEVGRRQFIAQMLNKQQNSSIDNPQPSKQYHVLNFNNAISKRKKIKELLYGQSLKNNLLQQKEKEELQQEKRYLKMQQNATNEENIRLKTNVQQLQNELIKRDKEFEQLILQFQHLQHGTRGQAVQINSSHVYESFLVSQLKRTNRELKLEVLEKDKVIDSLKKDTKYTKSLELETELEVYIQECNRLRGLLEQAFFERQHIMQNQDSNFQYQQQNSEDVQKLQEAYFEKENQLQLERQQRSQVQMNYMAMKEQFDKANEKAKLAESRVKKMNEMQSQIKRQELMLRQKNQEIIELKAQIETLKGKAQERDSVYNKNKELVTKQYSLQSAIEAKEKQIQQLKQENEKLQDGNRFGAPRPNTSAQQNPSPNRTSTTPNKVTTKAPPQPVQKYNENVLLYIQRALNNQPQVVPSDKTTYKNYVTTNKSDLEKELSLIKQIKITKQTKEQLKSKHEIIISNLSKNFTFPQLEKFFDDQLQVQDKAQSKAVIMHLILKESNQVETFNLSKLLTELKSPTFIDEESETVRVNESVGETTGQFMPPSNFNNTPLPEDQLQSTSMVQKKESSPIKTKTSSQNIKEVDEYEEDKFEQQEVTESQQTKTFQEQSKSKGEEKEIKVTDRDKDDEEQYDEHFEKSEEAREENQQEEEEYQEEGEQEQITEEQMLDIAESVFEMIGERLKQLNKSVLKAFGQQAQIVEVFEDRENVEIVGAKEFLEALDQLQIKDLSQIQVACLMQVLSRPELEHAIILQELQMVLSNFGVPEDDSEEKEKSKEQLVNKKQKQNKKKLIQSLVLRDDKVYSELFSVLKICDFQIDIIQFFLDEKFYEQLVKQKSKEIRYIVIKKIDFYSLIKEKTGVQISSEVQEKLSPILQLDSKYSEIFLHKWIMTLFQEALTRTKKEEEDQQKLQEFYKPQMEEGQEGSGAQGEVMNFEQMMENYEDDYEKDQLNAIAEDQMEQSASPGRSKHINRD